MRKYLDSTFWKVATGFLLIVLVVLGGIIFLGHYNDVRYGNGQEGNDQMTPIINQEARNNAN